MAQRREISALEPSVAIHCCLTLVPLRNTDFSNLVLCFVPPGMNSCVPCLGLTRVMVCSRDSLLLSFWLMGDRFPPVKGRRGLLVSILTAVATPNFAPLRHWLFLFDPTGDGTGLLLQRGVVGWLWDFLLWKLLKCALVELGVQGTVTLFLLNGSAEFSCIY